MLLLNKHSNSVTVGNFIISKEFYEAKNLECILNYKFVN